MVQGHYIRLEVHVWLPIQEAGILGFLYVRGLLYLELLWIELVNVGTLRYSVVQ